MSRNSTSPRPTFFSAPYVDGALLVDSTAQRLRLGRTDGLRERTPPITGAAVEVTDLTTGQSYAYAESPREPGLYTASFAAELDHAYQLAVDAPGFGTYRSRPDSLSASPIALSAEAGVQVRLDREGVARERRAAGTRYSLRNDGPEPDRGVLTLRPFLVWSYGDRACGMFGGRAKCYLEEDGPDNPFAAVDLSTIAAGDTASVFVGGEGIDFRFAEEAFFYTEVYRYAPAAAPYFRAVAQVLNPSGATLDERPRPVVGNMRAEDDAAAMLGYFGVAASTPLVTPTRGVEEIDSRTGLPICARERDAPPELDCCECASTPGALTRRPAYLP